MPKTRIQLPEKFSFTTMIPVRITDLNYGGHVGNDSVLALIHEARVRFLRNFGYGELDMAGVGLIMADAAIEFRNELFYGEALRASVAANEFSRIGFDLYYRLEKAAGGSHIEGQAPGEEKWIPVAFARTGMVCYDYTLKKIASVPKEVCSRLLA